MKPKMIKQNKKNLNFIIFTLLFKRIFFFSIYSLLVLSVRWGLDFFIYLVGTIFHILDYIFFDSCVHSSFDNCGRPIPYFHILEKTLILGKIEGRRRRDEDEMVG